MKAFVWHERDSFLQGLNPLTKLAACFMAAAVVPRIEAVYQELGRRNAATLQPRAGATVLHHQDQG